MKNSPKARVSAVRKSLRQVAAALRPTFPAWIDDAQGLPFSATVPTPRVRDSLVLRLVAQKKPLLLQHTSYTHNTH
jgi:hypothetical protein